MAGRGDLNGHARGFFVTNLTNHQNVGVLSQQISQERGECQPELLVDLELVDERQRKLDRVFDGADVRFDGTDRIERRVERGAFSAIRRTGHQHETVRSANLRLETFEVFAAEAELRQRQRDVAAIEHADNGFLALSEWHRADTQVD